MPSKDDVVINRNGKEYTIREHDVMPLLADLEDTITLVGLQNACISGAPPLAKLSIAYAKVLKAAGCYATPQEVYAEMFAGEDAAAAAQEAIVGLLALMIPPSARESAGAAAVGKPKSRTRTKK